MASTGVNVLRWSALGLGVVYGFYHQSQITAKEKLEAANREYQHKQELINKAKAEYQRLHSPSDKKSGVIEDPSDPKFDLEGYLKAKLGAN